MSEHFRKDAPHYEFSTVRIRLDEWLEDRSSGTLFGPKGCGKDTFLKDYFTPEKCRALAADPNKPTIVLVWEGTTLSHRKDLDDLLACAFQEGFSYLKEQGLIDPALETLLTTAGGASAQSCAQEWKKRRYCFVLVILGFHNFICNIDGCQSDSVQQVNILKNSDAPLRMIVTNDYLYTAQYCPAMEDLAGSSIFNNLSLNQFTFSKNRPRPQEFSQYLGRIYRGGDTSPFTPEEDHWLLEMTGGFPAIVPDAAEALFLAKEDGLEGQEAFEDCVRTCMLPEETVYLLLSQWLKDLDDREFEILTRISHFGLAGADEEDVDRPQSVQRGLVVYRSPQPPLAALHRPIAGDAGQRPVEPPPYRPHSPRIRPLPRTGTGSPQRDQLCHKLQHFRLGYQHQCAGRSKPGQQQHRRHKPRGLEHPV